MYDTGHFWPFRIMGGRHATDMKVPGLLAALIAAGVVAGSMMAGSATHLEAVAGPSGRIATSTYDEHGAAIPYNYNLDGEPTAITYPNHKAVTRTYDRYGRLKEVTDWNRRTTRFSYDSNGNLTAITFPSATMNEDRYTYDSSDKMSGIKMLRGTEALASLHYARDGAGQVTLATSQELPSGKAATYAYGEGNRLIKAGGTEYAYDRVGDPTKIGAHTYTYNGADELEAGAGMTYTYNKAGQRIKATPTRGPATTYSYDHAGHLITVQRPGSSHEPAINDSYTYDDNGLRSSQTVDGRTSNLTWDTAEALPLLLSDGTNNYIYGPDGLPIEQISNAGTTLYFHHDQQGSTRLLTNTKGEVEGSYAYSPYGELVARTGTATTPLLYDGQYTNASTGLIYLRARSYDPTTAQFLSIDPALQVTGEPYAYAGDNPLNAADPTGRLTWRGWLGAGLLAVGVTVALVSVGPWVAGGGIVVAGINLATAGWFGGLGLSVLGGVVLLGDLVGGHE